MNHLLKAIIGLGSLAAPSLAVATDLATANSPTMRLIQIADSQPYPGSQDTPSLRSRNEVEQAIAPHIAAARRSLPTAKQRFLKGLPRGTTFFLTIAVQDGRNKENAYIQVERWNADKITGLVATELQLVRRYKISDRVVVSENDVIDWTITSESGKEEGNFIGKFLDSQKR